MNKYLIELVGTFFLVLVIGLTGDPLAIGAVLIAMIYMGGYISGAHYNPAVSLAVYLRGRMESRDMYMYMLFQAIGGFLAALVYLGVKGSPFVPSPAPETSFLVALLFEILFTFALASVVLHVATSDKVKGNYYYGVAIGLTVIAAAFAIGPISGAALNPAVAVGPMLLDIQDFGSHVSNLALYLIGPFIGGTLASSFYKMTTLEK